MAKRKIKLTETNRSILTRLPMHSAIQFNSDSNFINLEKKATLNLTRIPIMEQELHIFYEMSI